MSGGDQQFLEGAEQAVIVTDAERRITFWNRAAEKLYGWTAAEVVGRNILEVTPIDPADAVRVLEPVEAGASWAGEFRVRRKSGESFPAFVTITPLHDPAGRPVGVLGLSFAVHSPAPTSPQTRGGPAQPVSLMSFRQSGIVREMALAVGLTAIAALLRSALGSLAPGVAPFVTFYPAVLLASVFAGWRSGVAATALALLMSWFVFLPPAFAFNAPSVTQATNLAAFAMSSLALVASGAYARRLIDTLEASRHELSERNLRFNAVFDEMSEGFALCQSIRDSSGRLTDYVILEMNGALQAMLGVGPEAIGTRLSDSAGDRREWLEMCDRVMRTGRSQGFEFHNPATSLWHEIRINRVDDTRMAQLFFDITARKQAEEHQARLFDELNHRVKNNLTIVSSLLQMQARSGPPEAREQLMKAVDRVASIAQVHGALYKGARRDDVDFAAYLQDLCGALSQSLVEDDRIALEVSAEPVTLPVDIAIPLGMVVNELVTNAFKHAYPPPLQGTVSVECRHQPSGLLLSVGDNGAGLPQADTSPPGSLGMKLVTSLVDQVGAELVVRHHPGATFDIRLPAKALQGTGGEQLH